MTIVNFAVAIAVPKLTRRYGNGLLLASGLAITTVGMFWLSRLSVDTPYPTGVALPMVLIGAGQGAALSPLTAAGISGVNAADAAPPPGWSTSHINSAARWAWASSSPSSRRRRNRARRQRASRAPRLDRAHRRHRHARA
jgi:hypothetical protein